MPVPLDMVALATEDGYRSRARNGTIHVARGVLVRAGCTLHVRRGYIPGKWMLLSGLIIEVTACTVPSVQVGTSRAGSAGRLSGKGFRTGCSSQVLVNRSSLSSLSGFAWIPFFAVRCSPSALGNKTCQGEIQFASVEIGMFVCGCVTLSV